MEAVFGILNMVVRILGPLSLYLFLGAFLGLLYTFLWFFFRWLDMRALILPVIVFSLFFLLFLSSGALLILQDSGVIGDSPADEVVAETIALETAPIETLVL